MIDERFGHPVVELRAHRLTFGCVPADGHYARTRLVTKPADLGGNVVGGQARIAYHRIQRGIHHVFSRGE